MEAARRKTRSVAAGSLLIGGGYPVSVQTMTRTDTRDVEATVAQVLRLQAVGADLVRLAVPDREAGVALAAIRRRIDGPLSADIHFDHQLAIMAIDAGIDELRLNPGNIGGRERVREVALAARGRPMAIRVGVNAGSLERRLRSGRVTAEALAQSALHQAELLEEAGFRDITISVKAFEVPLVIDAYRRVAASTDYPLHLGVTESGSELTGSIRSAVGIGVLLAEGIGDTIRVSLAAPPESEVRAGKIILASLGLGPPGPEVVACPTCGRCELDLAPIVRAVEERLAGVKRAVRVAVMGCVVNGPGEARQADIGLAGGKDSALLFCKGEVIGKLPRDRLLEAFLVELDRFLAAPGHSGADPADGAHEGGDTPRPG
ncbi:MAG TPA: flavodoxin-dependent (E)-4-hydroxy-3-methylbut-2-enyl-diphosphate synthase [Bacillota bacterium]|nr:flavodoxin-dependent (E)-4-hydroxy-3-methylbut-2-enyl-diphosphate synthase [Bacillota bacterium]